MMIVAGAFLGANLIERQSEDSLVYGWPIAFHERPLNPRDHWIDYYRIEPIERMPRLILDIGVFLFAIVTIVVASEWRIRRREVRKP